MEKEVVQSSAGPRHASRSSFTVEKVAAEMERLLHDEAYKKEMLASYEHLISLLGTQPASVKAAEYITSRP